MPRGVPRTPIDKPIIYHDVPVLYLDGTTAEARAEGNNVTWMCRCDEPRPLLGRCYYQFNWLCHAICPTCHRRYRVTRNAATKRAQEVREI